MEFGVKVAEWGMKAENHPLAKSGWAGLALLSSKPKRSCWWDQ